MGMGVGGGGSNRRYLDVPNFGAAQGENNLYKYAFSRKANTSESMILSFVLDFEYAK